MPRLFLPLYLMALLLAPLSVLAADEIRFTSSAEVELRETNAKGETVLVRKPADKVPPGGIVIMVNAFTNLGKTPKEKLVITNPVPKDTEYVAGSAEGIDSTVVFSVDGGKNFAPAAELFITDAKGSKRPAQAKDYTHIRWTITPPLKPGSTGLVEFRVRVK